MRLLLCLPFLPALLGAQDLGSVRHRPPDLWRPGSLAALRETLAQERGALLVVLDPDPAGAESALRELLAEESLAVLGLRSLALDPAKGLGREIPARASNPPGSSRWVLMGPGGDALAEGPGLPKADTVLKAFQASGCRSRLQALREFHTQHPDQLNGVVALLRELKRLGDMRTRKAVGNAQPPAPREETLVALGALNLRAEEPYAENQVLLGEEEDEAIWSEAQEALSRRMGDLIPLSSRLSYPLARLVPDCLWASPRLQAWARALIPEVETALAGRPSDRSLWELRIALQAGDGGRSLSDLLDNLVPSPLVPPGSWPPASIRTALLRDCRDRSAWRALADLAEPAWKDLLEKVRARPRESADLGALSAGVWSELCDPLLEAYVRLRRYGDADSLLKEWMALSPWKGAATRAQAIALDCGEESFLRRWSDLLQQSETRSPDER